eukprot:1137212-Pelagomonas_calceolata.AAC.2
MHAAMQAGKACRRLRRFPPLSSCLSLCPACDGPVQVVDKQFETDWSRVSSKVRFRKLVTRQDSGLRDQAELDRELREVRSSVLRSLYNKYKQGDEELYVGKFAL